MKQQTTKSKIIYAIIILVIILGAVAVYLKGFNFELQYQQNKMMEIYIGKEFNIADVRQITNEVFGEEQVLLQTVEMFKDRVAITAADITEEQKASIVEKMNEKYGLELEADSVTIENVPHTRLRDILKPYVLPLIIATVVTLIYIAIRYYKLGVIKTIFKTGIIAVLAQLFIFSLMAITGFPIGRFTIPIMLFVYVLSMLYATTKLEKDLESKQAQIEETQEV